jgi:hypothetical protein
MLVNPFNFETPADRWSFTDRQQLIPQLSKVMESPRRRMLVHGRRRMGKTSLIRHVAHLGKHPFIFADLSTATNLTELAQKLVAAVPGPESGLPKKILQLLAKYVQVISVKGGKFALEGQLRSTPPEQTLDSALDFIDDLASASDECWTICLDEFQDIRQLGGERADWRLRGTIQHHRSLSYIFSGSDERLLGWMTEPRAAFFKQLELLEVGPLEPALVATWIDQRAKQGGLPDPSFGAEVVAAAGPCTGDIVRLAKVVFDLLAAGRRRTDTAGEGMRAVAMGYLQPEFVGSWRLLTVNQRSMLRAIATGQRPLAADTLEAYAIKAASSASKALEALVDRQILIHVGDRLAFDNPFFEYWVKANAVPEAPTET